MIVTVTSSLSREPQAAQVLTVGDLVALTGVTLFESGSGHLDAPVHGAAITEHLGAVDQIEQGWLAVTDGSGLSTNAPHDPTSREFVRQLKFRGATGLVIRLGHGWNHVPEAIADESLHLGLPVFLLPAEESPALFLRLIHQAGGMHEVTILSRALSVQTELIDALTYPDVEHELINRLSNRLGVSAILYDSRKIVLASQGEAPVHLIREQIAPDSDAEKTFSVGRWQVSIAPVSVPGQIYWLALAWHESVDLSHEIIRSTKYALQQLLRAHLTTRQNSRRQDQMQRSQLLSEILEGVTDSRLARLRDQLVLLNFPREGEFQIHVMRDRSAVGIPSTDSGVDPVLETIQAAAEAAETSVLLGAQDGQYVVLYPTNENLAAELLLLNPLFNHGISAAFSDLNQTRMALRQAEMSALTSARSGMLTPFAEVGFINFVLAQVPAETFAAKVAEILASLPEGISFEETLISYLLHGMDIQSTARAMHLHPNSIRYRLARVEEHLERSLADPETITLLFLALHDRLVPGESGGVSSGNIN